MKKRRRQIEKDVKKDKEIEKVEVKYEEGGGAINGKEDGREGRGSVGGGER